ncbi:PilZ domain-containing protein [Maridesulfovibrio zosterae]|uniref:PilZ domain-containing protein n=1 Tax=Maridesulfovibrio zosterae TaxID=82171 RepID=UPI00041FA3E1|nr:PilZ domain-containing protein [Maridesulfovibrio zosterae]
MVDKQKEASFLSKLKNKLDRMLGRKNSESLDIKFKPAKSNPSARRAYRIDVDNMHVICRNPRIKCRISDISATGIGFISSKEFPVGETVEAILFWSGKPVLKELHLKIMRHNKKLVGCEFQNLERGQDKIISKLVLAAQKRQIQKKHNNPGTDKVEKEVDTEIDRHSKRGEKKDTTPKIKL